jgi:Cft2 family RNA processing exonuclease
VKWAKGVAVEYGETKVIFDSQASKPTCPYVFITHAHWDHAKGFDFQHQTKFSTEETYELVKTRKKGKISNWNPVQYGRKVKIGDLEIEPHDAGHILGSVQYEVTSPEGNLIYTGDFNFKDTLTMKAAEAHPCDTLIIETTFGAPGFTFPPEEQVSMEIVKWAVDVIKHGKTPVFQADSVGNSQELVQIFNKLTTLPVATHPSVTKINKVYEAYGHDLEYITGGDGEETELAESSKRVFVAPKRFRYSENSDYSFAYVSGWASRMKGDSEPFPLSDHADFNQLLKFVEECKPKLVLTCHGGRFNEVFARYVTKKLGIEARPLNLISTTLMPYCL